MPVLRTMAGPTVTFLGFQPDEVVREYYRRCRALLFPGEEDIGLTPIEAQASGRPVIAYGRGGALETVVGFYPSDHVCPETSTGVFFAEQSVDAVIDAILAFESAESQFSPAFIRHHAERFDATRFEAEMARLIWDQYAEFQNSLHLKRDYLLV